MLSASGAIREGQYVVHTSGRHGLAVLEPAARRRCPRDRAAPGDDLHRHRGRPAPPGGLRLRRHRRRRRARAHRAARRRPRRSRRCGCPRTTARSTTRVSPTAPTTSSPWSTAGDGAAVRRRRCRATRAATLRPLLTAALDNALAQGDAALTGPIVRGDVETVRAHLADIAATAPADAPVVRRHGARHPRPRRPRRPAAADPRGQAGCGPRRGGRRRPRSTSRALGRPSRSRCGDDRHARPRAHPRGAAGLLAAPAATGGASPSCRPWAPCTRGTPA